MANINDIIVKIKTDDEMFNEYLEFKTLGENIFKSFKKLYEKNKGFPISSIEKRFGTISNTMGLSTLLEIDSMGVDISTFDKGFKFLIKYVFEKIYKNGLYSNPEYDATPYINSNTELTSYVETASKVTIVMNDLRQFAYLQMLKNKKFGEPLQIFENVIETFDDLATYAEKAFIDGVKFLVDSALTVKEKDVIQYDIDRVVINRPGLPSEIKYRGWAICPPGDENDLFDTSIYYSYHATNVYVEIYNTYSDILTDLLNEKYGIQINNVNESQDSTFYDDVQLKLREINKEFLSQNLDLIDQFKKIVSSTGRYFEKQVEKNNIDISFDYIRTGFKKVTSGQIMDFQDNNAVINTLFVIAIYLNSGIDEDYESQGREQKQWFYNQLQYAIDNIKKIYNYLKTKGQHESIDSFDLKNSLLSEKISPKYSDVVRELRLSSKNIYVYDLVPLLCNTYSIVFDFIIKYPQIDMIENLEILMEKCSSGDEWIWGDESSSDISFNANNNLYSILAIENFYKYYEGYESALSGKEKEYNKKVNQVKAQCKTEIEVYKKTIEVLKQERDEFEKKYNDKNSILDEEVIRLAQDVLDKQFEERIENYFDSMIKNYIDFSIQLLKGKYTEEQLEDLLARDNKIRDILIFDHTLEVIKTIDHSKIIDMKDNLERQKKIDNDIIRSLIFSLKDCL